MHSEYTTGWESMKCNMISQSAKISLLNEICTNKKMYKSFSEGFVVAGVTSSWNAFVLRKNKNTCWGIVQKRLVFILMIYQNVDEELNVCLPSHQQM